MSAPKFNALYSAHTYTYAGKDVPWLIKKWADATPDKTFLIWQPREGESKQWTYAEFWLAMNQVANGLIAQGVKKGDKVLIHSENSPEMMIAWYASAIIGSVGVTTNTRCIGEELSYFAEHSEATICITQPKFIAELVANAKTIKSFIVSDSNSGEAPSSEELQAAEAHITFASLYKHGDEAPIRSAEPMLPVGIQYTSGTTSRPKAVVHTHANALWGGQMGAENLGIDSSDTYLCFLPCFHVNAQSWTFWTMTWAGGTVVLQPKFSASKFWEVSLKHQCTRASMIPFCFKAIGAQAVPEHFYKSWSTGVKLPMVEGHWKVKTFATWGMTETVTHATRSHLHHDCPDMNIGMPTPGYEFAIINPETGEYSDVGENGDLYIRGVPGIQLFLEYYKNPEAMKKAFTEDGWFATGDQIRLGEDGYLYFGDRDNDVLKVGGENVSARQVEEAINAAAPYMFAEVAVVAQKHDMLDEVPVVFAIKGAYCDKTEQELEAIVMEYCKANLADFKCPHKIYFVEDMPRATLDKVAKNKLREMADQLADEEKAQA